MDSFNNFIKFQRAPQLSIDVCLSKSNQSKERKCGSRQVHEWHVFIHMFLSDIHTSLRIHHAITINQSYPSPIFSKLYCSYFSYILNLFLKIFNAKTSTIQYQKQYSKILFNNNINCQIHLII